MLAAKSINIRDNFKEWCDKVIKGETILVIRPKNENICMISEKEYNELQKAKRNAEYLEMLDRSRAQFESGETISFTLDELKAMESDGWKPTEKILAFEKKQGIERTEE